MFYIDEDFNNLRKLKKNHFGVKIQSHKLNAVLRKTAMIVRYRYSLQYGRSRKSAVWISKVSEETMKGQSKIIVQVIFHISQFRKSTVRISRFFREIMQGRLILE